MKRIVVLMLALCSLCAVCFAKLEQPTDERWVVLYGEKGKLEYWLDSNTVNFNTSTEIGHSNHESSQMWLLVLDYEKGLEAMILQEFDFQCRTVRILGGSIYNDRGELLSSYDKDSNGTIIAPGSGYESIMIMLSDMKAAKKNSDVFERIMQDWKDNSRIYKETGDIPNFAK